MTWFYAVFMNKLLRVVLLELVQFFLHGFGSLSRVKALHCTSVGFRFLNIKLGKANKLVLVSGVCQIDPSCQNSQRVIMP